MHAMRRQNATLFIVQPHFNSPRRYTLAGIFNEFYLKTIGMSNKHRECQNPDTLTADTGHLASNKVSGHYMMICMSQG